MVLWVRQVVLFPTRCLGFSQVPTVQALHKCNPFFNFLSSTQYTWSMLPFVLAFHFPRPKPPFHNERMVVDAAYTSCNWTINDD